VTVKIVSRRDAERKAADDNGRVELPRESERLLETARRIFSGRDGRIALTLVLVVTAAVEASLYTQDASEYGGGGNPAAAVLLNVLAVLPLLATNRFPLLAAVGASLVSLVILASSETAITLSALGVMLYAVGHLVARRGLPFAIPFLLVFFAHAVVPFDGGSVGLSSIGPFLLVVAAVLVGESRRKQAEAVSALDATEAAMAESVREQTAMEVRAAIARELHDIVAHHLSVIAVQSETARLTSPKLSSDARGRFEAIAATARDALSETRRLLGVLREDVDGRPTVRRDRVSISWASSSTRHATPGRTSASSCRGRSSRCRRASTWPRTESCRRH
jgi:signal transduction histidine kinase